MTEAAWLACEDPTPMLAFLSGKVSERKLRLFACDCSRRVWNLISDKFSRKALTIAERYADAEVSEEKLGFAWGDARRAVQVEHRRGRETAVGAAMWAVSELCQADIGVALRAVDLAARCEAYPYDRVRLSAAQREQVLLLREIFGNPFRPVAFDPEWRTSDVVALARGIYEERAFDRMPILADALQDAGCESNDILGHLRDPAATHVRGCWALDLVLGKS